MMFMNFKNLCFSVACLLCQPLFAQVACDLDFDNLQINVNNEIKRLAENVTQNDLENTTPSKSFAAKLKTFYKYALALKSAVYLILAVVILIICFSIYKYGKMLVDLIISLLEWVLHFFKKPNAVGNGPKDDELQPPDVQQSFAERIEQNKELIEPLLQELSNPEIIHVLNLEPNAQDEYLSSIEVQVEQKHDISATKLKESDKISQMSSAKPRICQSNSIDFALNADLEQQIAIAKSIGLEQLTMFVESIQSKNDSVAGLKIADQIEYAKKIGLVPAITPATQ
ncbi:MAG: hypothetical protein US49_C0005G0075 [candidate division TM6 bacterium GW2011_GWF2_37_49]|nr:MAG: hypothetical protein US49_C0005G0075 [candidate division TM6 bacterium GW2011_GWF2_37_49]